MNILYVYTLDEAPSPKTPIRSPDLVQMGFSQIISLAEDHGYHATLLVLGSNSVKRHNMALLDSAMQAASPGLVCFTAVATQYPFVVSLAQHIKARYADTFLLIGGVHASLNPGAVIQDCFDGLCVGEGEFPTVELAGQLESGTSPRGIANLWIKKPDGSVEKNAPRPFMQDLDSLPLVNRKIWQPWIREPTGMHTVLLGRGCPYSCTYCCNHALRKLSVGKYVRMRSPANILAEIERVHRDYPATREVYLEVESIALDREWLKELSRKMSAFNSSNGHPFRFGTNYRVSKQSCNGEVFDLLREAGVGFINVGLESGCEHIRRDVLKRDYTNEQFLEARSLARERGIAVNTFNLLGIPGETLSDHMETVRVNRECQPEGLHTSIFFPYPGTELHERCRKEGLLKRNLPLELERRRSVLDLPGFSKRQIQHAFRWFEFRVYQGHRPTWKLLLRVALSVLWGSPRIAAALRRMRRMLTA